MPAVMPGVQIYSPERYAARNCPVLWKRWLAGMISRNRPDLLHGTSDIFSDRLLKDFPDLKCVVTVHDFSFLSVRTGFSWIQRHRYNIMLRRSCRRAALVVSLDEDREFALDEDPTVRFKIQDGAIAFIDATCPDKICEQAGYLSRVGETAACLPRKTVLTVISAPEEKEADVIAG